ncbi:hypothetical protein [Neobacillus drentensis]|nr:hypothetical protein [Neobacillus drentensis]
MEETFHSLGAAGLAPFSLYRNESKLDLVVQSIQNLYDQMKP